MEKSNYEKVQDALISQLRQASYRETIIFLMKIIKLFSETLEHLVGKEY